MSTLDSTFHALHQHGLLMLANVADAGGARIVERLGSPAVATSSAAMAWAHGYQDGNQLPLAALDASLRGMVREIAEVCRGTRLPVNLLLRDGLPGFEELQRLGVRRLSAGSSIAEFLYGAMGGLARGFLDNGRLPVDGSKAFTYSELNELMRP